MASIELPYFVPLGKGVKILAYHPMGLVALEKPEGMLSIPNTPNDLKRTILRSKFSKKKEAYVWFDTDQQQRFFYVCHRLDSPTSGVMLGTLDEEVAIDIRELFRTKDIQKAYIAIVADGPKEDSGQWSDNLKSSKEKDFVRTRVSRGGGDLSVTSWNVLKRRKQPWLSMMSLKPHTGRTHQLRVQSASRNMGIVGDRTYGDFKLNTRIKKEFAVKRMLLHAHKVTIDTPDLLGSRFRFSVESPIPEVFTQLFDKAD